MSKSIEKDFMSGVIRSSTGAWFETNGKIWAKDRTKGLTTPKQNFLQNKIQRVVDRCEELEIPVRILGLKPRARGSTTYFTALGYTLMRRTSTSAVFIGGQSDQTVGLWNMLKTYKENDSFDWGNTGDVNEKGANFSNGSRAKKETAKDLQAGIGDTYQLLHATEAARWARYGVANASDVMVNILKAVPRLPHTYIFLESTAEGRSGDFYQRWLDATDAEDFLEGKQIQAGSYIRVFAPWFEFLDSAIRLSDEEKRKIQLTLDDDDEYSGEKELIEMYGTTDEEGVQHLGHTITEYDIWEQLAWRRICIHDECKRDKNLFDRDYPHSWQSAFQKSGNLRFNQTGINVLRKRLALVVPRHGLLEETKDKRIAFRQTDLNGAKVTIFEQPTRGCHYLLTVDPMTGASQTSGVDPDLHGIFVLRKGFWDTKGQWNKTATAARIIPCRWDIDVVEEPLWRLARYYGNRSGCKIVIEMNMDRGLTELLKKRGADLYRREIFNQLEQKTTKAFGFLTNEKTRENLIEKLASAIRSWDEPGQGIDILCPHAVTQCENFIIKANGRSEAAEGFHDDDVLAIGLGLEVIEQATMYVPVKPLPGWGEPPMQRHDGQETTAGAFT